MEPLSRLLRPASIAVIGGGAWCANVIAQCERIGFDGPVWPVHPGRDMVAGRRAFRSVAALPGVPDAAFLGVNRLATVEAVGALSARGAGGAVCFASGFRESVAETGDGGDLEGALVAAAGEMRILGPNCYGFLNLLDGAALWPDCHGAVRTGRGVAIVTQSSNIAINLTMQTRSLPLAYVVTAGNQAQTRIADIAEAILEDGRVTALGLHVEGIGDPGRFERMAARARNLGKPVVALKTGQSDQARATALSHTGALAGSDAGARALFERLGIGRVETPAELLEALKLLHVTGPLASNRIASMSCSGGEAGLMADRAARHGLACPTLTDTQRAGLRAVLGPKVALSNPLDYHTFVWGDRSALARTFAAMMIPQLALGVVVLDFPRADRCDAAAWHVVVDAVADAIAASGRPMAILSTLPETMPEPVAEGMIARGIVPLCGLAEGLAAIALAVSLGAPRPAAGPLVAAGPDPGSVRLLSEAEAKARLAACGVPVPRSRQVAGAAGLAAAAEEIGFPVVLKALGLAHKTDAGAVRVGLGTAQAVCAAASRMTAAEYLVEEMIAGGIAELLVGVIRDPAHGFVLTLGAGGVLAEILADTASLLLPAGAAEIEEALDRLRIAPLLTGYRGAPAADRASLVAAILAIQDCAIAHADGLMELEVNPLVITERRAVAVDALIRLGDCP